MGAYKSVQRSGTLVDALADAFQELEDLKDEMNEWRDGMDGTGLENTEKFSEVEDAADTLDNIEAVELPDSLEGAGDASIEWVEMVNRRKGRGPSRAIRCGNAVAAIEAAIYRLEEGRDAANESGAADMAKAIEDVLEELESAKDEAESVEFPGMF